ncbi:MAG: hypothetical protein ACM37W_14480 [Actinomycetota bacterium]
MSSRVVLYGGEENIACGSISDLRPLPTRASVLPVDRAKFEPRTTMAPGCDLNGNPTGTLTVKKGMVWGWVVLKQVRSRNSICSAVVATQDSAIGIQ